MIKLAFPFASRHPQRKLSKFIIGQKGIKSTLDYIELNPSKRTIWIHASSFGEFAIARPLISLLRDYNIVITFFSPSGYEPVTSERKYRNVLYLPLDTRRNVKTFLDIVKPDAAVFMVSELWVGYLNELYMRHVPTILVSALIRRDSVYFKPYGILYRHVIRNLSHIFCLDQYSYINLQLLKAHSVEISGDPLFDNASINALRPYSNKIVDAFKKDDSLFIAGSIDGNKDLKLVASLANRHRDIKFLIIPHTIGQNQLNGIIASLDGRTLLYSECNENTDFSDVQVLIIDYFGELPYLYRYGTWAYVGGGFSNYLHSVIEPVVYGLPVSFGPNIKRKTTPRQLIELGIGNSVANSFQLNKWFVKLRENKNSTFQIRRSAIEYVDANRGAYQMIVDKIKCLADGHSA